MSFNIKAAEALMMQYINPAIKAQFEGTSSLWRTLVAQELDIDYETEEQRQFRELKELCDESTRFYGE